MKNQRFYLYAVLSILSSVTTALLLHSLPRYGSITAGLTALAALGFSELAEKQAKRYGKTRNIKASLSIIKPLYEILILIGTLSLSVVTNYLAVFTAATVLFSQLTQEKMVNKLRQTIQPRLGQKLRVGITSLTIFLSSINSYYLFYGMWVVGGMAVYDILYIIYRSIRNH